MAGANNRSLKAHGFKAREVKKIRAGYGVISSAKDAANAAQRVGIAVPAKLQARIASATPATRVASDTDRGKALRGEVKRIAEQALGEATARASKAIRAQGELTEKSREVKFVCKFIDNDVWIM
jgi:hypothetical protein